MSVQAVVTTVVSGSFFRFFFFITLFYTPFIEAKRLSAEEEAYIAQYAMPQDHPIKERLDALFRAQRVIFNIDTLKDAGFNKPVIRNITKLIVTTHRDLPGYIFKLFLDIQRPYKEAPEYDYWISRIRTANAIRNAITERNLESEFKVPHKWLYVVPSSPKPPLGYFTKHYVLVAEDMDLYSEKNNVAIWKSNTVTQGLLQDLYGLLKDLGLQDCTKPENIPFSKDGRIAFIDTQFMNRKVVFKSLTSSLSPSNQIFWKSLINN